MPSRWWPPRCPVIPGRPRRWCSFAFELAAVSPCGPRLVTNPRDPRPHGSPQRRQHPPRTRPGGRQRRCATGHDRAVRARRPCRSRPARGPTERSLAGRDAPPARPPGRSSDVADTSSRDPLLPRRPGCSANTSRALLGIPYRRGRSVHHRRPGSPGVSLLRQRPGIRPRHDGHTFSRSRTRSMPCSSMSSRRCRSQDSRVMRNASCSACTPRRGWRRVPSDW